MLSWFKSRAEDRLRAIDFYGAIVARARAPALFASHGVLDTPEGRTAAIILLMFPLLERLQGGSPRDRRVARLMIEAFITDIDDCLREMGVGDLAVPKKVKRVAQALGERCLAYRRAVASPDPVSALTDELVATVPGLDLNAEGAETLARLTLQSAADLGTVPTEGLADALAALPESAYAASASQPERSL